MKWKLLLVLIISLSLILISGNLLLAEEEKALQINALANRYAHLNIPLDLDEDSTYTFQAEIRHGDSPGSSMSGNIYLHWADTNHFSTMVHFPAGNRIAFPGSSLDAITEPNGVESWLLDPDEWDWEWKGVKIEFTSETLRFYLRFDKGEWILIGEEDVEAVEGREGMPSNFLIGKAWLNEEEGNMEGWFGGPGFVGQNWIADVVITEDGEEIFREDFVELDPDWEKSSYPDNPEDAFQIVDK